MGGGGNYGHSDLKTFDEKVYDAMMQGKLRVYKSEINDYLQELLKDYNNRDVESINTHLKTLKDALEKELDGTVDMCFGGSVNKHTYVNGLSDVDVLARINSISLQGKSPREVLEYFASKIQKRFPHTDVSIGNLAITVKFKASGHEIQILPSIQMQSGIKIANAEGNKWSPIIKPHIFAKKLIETNRDNNGMVVPVIKIFKGINKSLEDKSQLSGYHVESMAINAFKNYSGPKTYYDMIKHLCNHVSSCVMNPIKDSTGQSIHVDDYLGSCGSLERQRIMKSYERVSNKIKIAEIGLSNDDFNTIIGH